MAGSTRSAIGWYFNGLRGGLVAGLLFIVSDVVVLLDLSAVAGVGYYLFLLH